MSAHYDHQAIENKWKQQWEYLDLYKTYNQTQKPLKYVLDAFPYPSGAGLHVGHAEGYTGTDILSRFYRMTGHEVLHPMGWDAFGLPAENYAIKMGVPPRENTDKAIAVFKQQIKNIGLSYDWSREIGTHQPEFYTWTQWMFSLLYKKGLAYKKEALVNWDPVDKTVLANEQVLSDGTAERSGAMVEQRKLSQWFFKITDYAERLLDDLDDLDWPESTKQMQRNWIGKSTGAVVRWQLADPQSVVFECDGVVADKKLPIRERGVALIRIKETGQFVTFQKNNENNPYYFIPGGELEPGENAFQAAEREAFEEIGLEDMELVSFLGTCDVYNNRFSKEPMRHIEHAYLFEISQQDLQKITPSELQTKNYTLQVVSEYELHKNNWPQLNWQIQQITQPNIFEIETFTTRIDTIYGATYVVLAPEHHLVDVITTPEYAKEVKAYQEKTGRKSQLQRTDLNKDKSGVWTGSFAKHPFTGQLVPVFIADYVLATYGTGAIMAVPAHDERDYEFAQTLNKSIAKNFSTNFAYQPSDAKGSERAVTVLFDIDSGLYGIQSGSLRLFSHIVVTDHSIEDSYEHLHKTLCLQGDYQEFEIGTDIKAGMTNEFKSYQVLHARLMTVSGTVADDVQWLGLVDAIKQIESIAIYKDNREATIEILKRAASKAIQLGYDTTHSIDTFNRLFPIESPEIIVPLFGEDLVADAPTVERETVRVFVRNKVDGNWLGVRLLEYDKLQTIIVGGIEKNENLFEAACRELKEEAGISGCTLVEVLDIPVLNMFYAKHKHENRVAQARAVVLEIDSPIINAEKRHAFVWIKQQDFANFLELDVDQYFWKRFNDPHHIYSQRGILIDSDEYTQMTSEDAKEQMAAYLEAKGWGKLQTTYKLRDWLVSRQRYWGSPIPIIYDKKGREHLVEESMLPVLLPEDVTFNAAGRNPLTEHANFHQQAIDQFGEGSRRETDTLDTFACSSWYYLRFCDPNNTDMFGDRTLINQWCPVDTYIIGAEHTVLHLLYARFFCKVLFDQGLIDFQEPFKKLVHPGIILAEDSRKMSKRWGNVINPDDVVTEFGADTMRMYEMFMGPFKQSKPWNTNAIKGMRKFLDRVWNVQSKVLSDTVPELEVDIHALTKKVTEDIPDFSFNTSIAEFMKFINKVEALDAVGKDQWGRFLQLLAPFAPFITEEMWQLLHRSDIDLVKGVHQSTWPEYDNDLLQSQSVVIGVQINGKRRAEITVIPDATEAQVRQQVMDLEIVHKWIEGKEFTKFVYIPGRVINIVVK
jgi:leucyl-tRNA synthetase